MNLSLSPINVTSSPNEVPYQEEKAEEQQEEPSSSSDYTYEEYIGIIEIKKLIYIKDFMPKILI